MTSVQVFVHATDADADMDADADADTRTMTLDRRLTIPQAERLEGTLESKG